MHALLACAGSHHDLHALQPLTEWTIHHRHQAVLGITHSLQRPPNSALEADAMLATCYMLATQSLYFDDGLHEFLVMVKGCGLLYQSIWAAGYTSHFKYIERLSTHEAYKIEHWKTRGQPRPDRRLLEGMKESLELLRTRCTEHGEDLLCDQLMSVAHLLPGEPLQALLHAGRTWEAFSIMSSHDFARFLDIDNSLSMCLLAHWLATLLLMSPLEVLDQKKQRERSNQAFAKWICQLIERHENVSFGWPARVAQLFQSGSEWWFLDTRQNAHPYFSGDSGKVLAR